jgi:hypothetical protein
LKYKTEQQNEFSVPCTVTENTPGFYKGNVSLPTDAFEILSVQYKLTDPGTPQNTVLAEEIIQLPVAAMVRFIDLQNENGTYNGMSLWVISKDPYQTNYKYITENKTSFTLGDLIPGIAYKYQLHNGNMTYATGSFTALSGSPTMLKRMPLETSVSMVMVVASMPCTALPKVFSSISIKT